MVQGYFCVFFLLFSVSNIWTVSSEPSAYHDSVSVLDAVEDIVQHLSKAGDWNVNDVSILKIDFENAKYSKATIYELNIQIGDLILPVKFIDEVSGWQHLSNSHVHKEEEGVLSNNLWISKALQSVLTPFHLSGPLDLSFESPEIFTESLEDIKHKTIKISSGNSIEVERAFEVSLAQPVEVLLPINRSSPIQSLSTSFLSLFGNKQQSSSDNMNDASRLSLHIKGTSLVASIKGANVPLDKADGEFDLGFLKLLHQEECVDESQQSLLDVTNDTLKASIWPFPLLNTSDPRIEVFEEILKGYLPSKKYERTFTILHAKVAALTFVVFEFDMERKQNEEDFLSELWPEWKTRPRVKHYTYQVLAKLQNNKLIPVRIQRLNHHKNVDTYSWKDVMSNESFTGLSSYIVPPNPMTLDDV